MKLKRSHNRGEKWQQWGRQGWRQRGDYFCSGPQAGERPSTKYLQLATLGKDPLNHQCIEPFNFCHHPSGGGGGRNAQTVTIAIWCSSTLQGSKLRKGNGEQQWQTTPPWPRQRESMEVNEQKILPVWKLHCSCTCLGTHSQDKCNAKNARHLCLLHLSFNSLFDGFEWNNSIQQEGQKCSLGNLSLGQGKKRSPPTCFLLGEAE